VLEQQLLEAKAKVISSGADLVQAEPSLIRTLFATRLYHAPLSFQAGDGNGSDSGIDMCELGRTCVAVAEEDEAGQRWCDDTNFPGYTSYASLNRLDWRFPIFAELVEALDRHVAVFAEDLEFDLGEKQLELDGLWINILAAGFGIHTGHIHPHSVVSGTAYIAMPPGGSTIKFEDPRLPMMMAAPPRAVDAREELRNFVYASPQAGDVLLWESWLRHEVPMHLADEDRISISFNYSWA
jgi:uncharacterized protein (TIGR02466 family)